jgi:hypothetical protein
MMPRSATLNDNHAENARDMIALRESLGSGNVTYAGLSALIPASEDPA